MAREDEIAAGRYAIPGRDKPGYNGVTGAPAQFDPASGMWIDANGVKIREDAIVSSPPPPKAAGAPTSGAAPVAAGGQPAMPEVGMDAGASVGALGAMAAQPAAGFQEFTSDSALNKSLGTRLGASSLKALSTMAGRNY